VAAAQRFLGVVAPHLEIVAVAPQHRLAEGETVAVALAWHLRARWTDREVKAGVVYIFALRDGRVADDQDAAALPNGSAQGATMGESRLSNLSQLPEASSDIGVQGASGDAEVAQHFLRLV